MKTPIIIIFPLRVDWRMQSFKILEEIPLLPVPRTAREIATGQGHTLDMPIVIVIT